MDGWLRLQPSESGVHLLSVQRSPPFSIYPAPHPECVISIMSYVIDIYSVKWNLYPQTAFKQQGAMLGFPVPLTSREGNQGLGSIPRNARLSAHLLMCLTPQSGKKNIAGLSFSADCRNRSIGQTQMGLFFRSTVVLPRQKYWMRNRGIMVC